VIYARENSFFDGFITHSPTISSKYKLSEKQGVEKPRSFVYSSERFAAATATDCMYKEFHVIIGIVFEGQSMNFTSVALRLAL
jgi:hypothetical protein